MSDERDGARAAGREPGGDRAALCLLRAAGPGMGERPREAAGALLETHAVRGGAREAQEA